MFELIGKNIDGFKILSTIGEGGMGIVCKAYDTKLDRYVAIKMMHPRTNQPVRLLNQFRKEAKHHAKLIHSNIVTVYGLLEYRSFVGIVMELIEGTSLAEMIHHFGRLSFQQTIKILNQILLGIQYAHSKGFIHRDIKPSNILIDQQGNVKIMDFGISKSLFDSAGFETPFSKIGTVFYMSPEQIRGESLTIASDIYSIGCTVYEMLTGNPPFYYTNEFDIMEGHLKRQPIAISSLVYGVPDWLSNIVLKSLEKNPNNRFFNCKAMLEEINSNISSSVTPVQTISNNKSGSKSRGAIRILFILILLSILVLIIYFIIYMFPVSSNTQLKDDSKQPRTLEQFIK